MRTSRLAVLASVLFMAVTPAQARFPHGSAPRFEGANWHQALDQVPCQSITKVGSDLQINGTIIVAGQSFPNYAITDEGQIKMVEKRCFPKH
jgi:hypothetical protein